MIETAGRYAKAIVGFLAPGIVVIGGALTAGSDGGSAITAAEWGTALVAAFGTGAAVALKGNADRVSDDRGREEPLKERHLPDAS